MYQFIIPLSVFLTFIQSMNYYYYQKHPFHNLLENKKSPLYWFSQQDSPKYNYYELAIQKWCQDDYQIHGLWPQYDADSYPINCPAPSYQPVYGDLLNEMNEVWHSCDSTQDFWNHEYTKHLSCIYEQYGLTEYDSFQLTVNLFNELTDSDFEKCNNNDDCIVACYNLYLEKINCPT